MYEYNVFGSLQVHVVMMDRLWKKFGLQRPINLHF